ncbi:hypothetical protein GCM10010289_85960 [Streptomyces violascens]|nr:hypothetical protein GCM10010289_85960 [Streptomyces violascens]
MTRSGRGKGPGSAKRGKQARSALLTGCQDPQRVRVRSTRLSGSGADAQHAGPGGGCGAVEGAVRPSGLARSAGPARHSRHPAARGAERPSPQRGQ